VRKNNIASHYLPEVYLAGFADDTGKLFQYFTKSSPAKMVSGVPSRFAKKRNLYALPNSDGTHNQDIEVFFADKVEGPLGEIIRRLKRKKEISARDRYVFSFFVSSIIPRGLEYLTAFLEWQKAKILKKDIVLPEQHRDSFVNGLNDKRCQLQQMLNVSSLISEDLCKRNWYFHNCSDSDKYLVSDAPILYLNENMLPETENPLKAAVFAFPITQHCYFLASHSKLCVAKLWKDDFLTRMNVLQAQNAFRYFYASFNDGDKYLTVSRQ